jgi:hypothetical protein
MKTESHLKPGPEAAIDLPLQIVLTSDQPNASAAARKLIAGFIARWAPDVEVHHDDWSFAELEHSEFRRESLELARHCDILIIALSGVEDLPESFLDWLNDWRQSRESKTTFILCVSARSPLTLPAFVSLPVLLGKDGLPCFFASLSLTEGRLTVPLNPKIILANLAKIDCATLPEASGLND